MKWNSIYTQTFVDSFFFFFCIKGRDERRQELCNLEAPWKIRALLACQCEIHESKKMSKWKGTHTQSHTHDYIHTHQCTHKSTRNTHNNNHTHKYTHMNTLRPERKWTLWYFHFLARIFCATQKLSWTINIFVLAQRLQARPRSHTIISSQSNPVF